MDGHWDGIDGPTGGEFGGFQQPLSTDIIPPPGSPWFPHLNSFALSFDGYAAYADLGTIANQTQHRWAREGVLPDDLVLLRSCLFYEARRQRHLDQPPFPFPPEGEWLRYVHALTEAIRSHPHTPEGERGRFIPSVFRRRPRGG